MDSDIQPLFSSLHEESDGDDLTFEMQIRRLPISSSGVVTATCVHHATADYISPEVFMSEYRGQKPLLLKNCGGQWKSVQIWSKNIWDCFAVVAPTVAEERLEVPVLAAKDGVNFLKHELCVSTKFTLLDTFTSIFTADAPYQRIYCRLYQNEYPQLQEYFDVNYLRTLADSSSLRSANSSADAVDQFVFKDSNIGLWFSSGGCTTPLHFDLCHGFLCQIVGKKRFCLLSPEDSSYVYWHESASSNRKRKTDIIDSGSTRNGTTSCADVAGWLNSGPSTEYKEMYPLLSEVNWWVADLEPGDILYTPPGWWHLVTSVTASVSYLVPFDPVPSRDSLPNNVMCC